MTGVLPPNQLTIFFGPITGLLPFCREALLSQDEKTRAARFSNPSDREAFIVSHVLLRKVLSTYLKDEPGQLIFDYGANGKPSLRDHSDLQFSLSHTRGAVLIGVMKDAAVGVDLECLGRTVDMMKLADFLFSPRELELFQGLAEEDKAEAFFNCWTRKEAFVKASGSGLRFPLRQLEVSFLKGEQAKVLSTPWSEQEKHQWYMESFDLDGDHRAAVAVYGPVTQITFIDPGTLFQPAGEKLHFEIQ